MVINDSMFMIRNNGFITSINPLPEAIWIMKVPLLGASIKAKGKCTGSSINNNVWISLIALQSSTSRVVIIQNNADIIAIGYNYYRVEMPPIIKYSLRICFVHADG